MASTPPPRHPRPLPSAVHRNPPPPPLPSDESAADQDIASWILEFVLRQPLPEPLLNAIFLALPLSPTLPTRLQKSILLRRLSADLRLSSITDRTLETLELIHALEPHHDHLLANAHCAVAVECAARHLRRRSEPDPAAVAVDRISCLRILDFLRSGAAASDSEKWVEWSPAALDKALYDNSAKNKRRALRRVEEYVLEATKAMGPPFLEAVANALRMSGQPTDPKGIGERENDSTSRTNGEKMHDTGLIRILSTHSERESLTQLIGIDEHMTSTTDPGQGTSKQGVFSTNNLDRVPATTEVSKVKMALKKSCEDLQMLVEDPLAVITATEAVENLRNTKIPKEPQRMSNLLDGNAPLSAIERVYGVPHIEGSTAGIVQNRDHDTVRLTHHVNINPPDPEIMGSDIHQVNAEAVHDEGTSLAVERNKHPIGPRPSLMRRNPTACTFEWDDDMIDSPSGSSSSHSKRIRLRSPKRIDVSPLTLTDRTRFPRCGKRKNWSVLEEDTLRKVVKERGADNTSIIEVTKNAVRIATSDHPEEFAAQMKPRVYRKTTIRPPLFQKVKAVAMLSSSLPMDGDALCEARH